MSIFRNIEEAPKNTVINGLMPDNKIERVQYVDDGVMAPLWKYVDAPKAGQMAPWPLGWLYIDEDIDD